MWQHLYDVSPAFHTTEIILLPGKGKTISVGNRGGGRDSRQEENQRQEERSQGGGEEEEEAEERAGHHAQPEPVPQPAGAPGGPGHAGGPQRARLLPLSPGQLRRDDRVRQPGLSHRVVPLRLHGSDHQAQGEVVLSKVCSVIQEETIAAGSSTIGKYILLC